MREIHEAILWWLVMWLPTPKESFFAYLLFACYHGKAHENFWDTIAPPRRSNSPWTKSWEQHLEFIGDDE